jgi:PBP1b-binding outer membrane lipoprotein LpoB
MLKSKYIVLAVLAALLLGACSSAVESTATQAPTQGQLTATERPATKTSAPTGTPTEPPPTATEDSQTAASTQKPKKATATADTQPATDTPVPADVFSFLEVQADEWVRGPADAPVTIIEYSDFQ